MVGKCYRDHAEGQYRKPHTAAADGQPDLTLPLARPITLTRGPRSHLVTLMDAVVLIRDLDRFRQADRYGTVRPK